MADLNIALILRLVDRATAPARTAMRALERIGGESMLRQAATVRRGSVLIGSGLGTIAGAGLRAAAVMTAYNGTLALVGASFVRQASQFEKFNVQLTNLEGSSEGAARAMSWIEDFATRTPLELEDTVSAYARLKAFGVDPTNGSLLALVDTMAATGGGVEQLDGLVLALGQAWTKGKLQGEEAMQMLERGVPVWDLLSEKTGKSAADLMELASKGKLGREEITLLIEALAERNAGASAGMAKTWEGVISNIKDQWTRFQRLVMAAGVFDFLKGRLLQLLDLLNEMAADGRLQRWAEVVADNIISSLTAIWNFGEGVVGVFQWLVPILQEVADLLGGWDVLGWSALALIFSRTLFAVALAIKAIGAGLLLLSATPLFLIAAAASLVAVSVYAIYEGWDKIADFFSQKFADIAAAFDSSMWEGWLKVLTEFNPGTLLIEFLVGLPVLIGDAFGIDLYGAGVKMIESLLNGIKAMMPDVGAYVTGAFSSMFPGYQAGGLAAIAGPDAPQNRHYPYGSNFVDSELIHPGALPPRRALGGGARAGQIYQWQEEGEEYFLPRVEGRVVSNRELRAMRAGRSAPSISIGEISIHAAPGQSPEAIARAVRRELERAARQRSFALHDGGGDVD